MKKNLFLLFAPLLLLCCGCSSDEMEEVDVDVDYICNTGTWDSYNLALKFVTPEGENIVSTLPVAGGSPVFTSRYYKIETLTRPEFKFTGRLLKGVDSAGDEYIKFSHEILTNQFISQFKFTIVYKPLFGDEKAHTIETEWSGKKYESSNYICVGFKLDGKECPVKIDEGIDESRIVVIELNRKK